MAQNSRVDERFDNAIALVEPLLQRYNFCSPIAILEKIDAPEYRSFSAKEIMDHGHRYAAHRVHGARLYVHVTPYCATKCRFCHHSSVPLKDPRDSELYTSRLLQQLKLFKDVCAPIRFNSLSLGGGTPNILSLTLMEKILRAVDANYSFMPGALRTLELFPAPITVELLTLSKKYHVNRLSIGIQSFNKRTLKQENRPWVPYKRIRDGLRSVQRVGFEEVNIDLLLGLPGETELQILQSFRSACKVLTDTITVYDIQQTGQIPLGCATNDAFFKKVKRIRSRMKSIAREHRFDVLLDGLYALILIKRGHAAPPIKLYHDFDYSCFGIGQNVYSRIFNTIFYCLTSASLDPGSSRPVAWGKLISPEEQMAVYVIHTLKEQGVMLSEFQALFHVPLTKVFKRQLRYLSERKLIRRRGDRITLSERLTVMKRAAVLSVFFTEVQKDTLKKIFYSGGEGRMPVDRSREVRAKIETFIHAEGSPLILEKFAVKHVDRSLYDIYTVSFRSKITAQTFTLLVSEKLENFAMKSSSGLFFGYTSDLPIMKADDMVIRNMARYL